ncbi:conserved Plasmodium protein, unknown function [Plasmodium sp. DRC-Itaito]|nr:conserved Plasmodium protein, unknown function [Plasmodium sp. DRC-Itaito]
MKEHLIINKEKCNDIEKHYRNPFINTKEDYLHEKVEKIICSLLLSRNIKKANCLVFDILFDVFMKIIKTIGYHCKKFSSLRGSHVVNYIDIKYCLKLAFYNIYNEIYILKDYSKLYKDIIYYHIYDEEDNKENNNNINKNESNNNQHNNNQHNNNNNNEHINNEHINKELNNNKFICDNNQERVRENDECYNKNEETNLRKTTSSMKIIKEKENYINVVQNSYLYYKHLCTKKNNNTYDLINNFNSINNLFTSEFYNKNIQDGNLSNSECVNILSLRENINVEKYKEIMMLKKNYIHDHMPIIPLSINRKEKITGYINESDNNEYDHIKLQSNNLLNNDEHVLHLSSCSSSSSSSSLSDDSQANEKKLSDLSNKNYNYLNTSNDHSNLSQRMLYEHSKENISKEKIEILNLLPRLKDIYDQNAKQKNDMNKSENQVFNSLNIFEQLD